MDTFKALVVREENGTIVNSVESISKEFLSDGDLLIKTAYSSVNYKDSLAVKKDGGVIKNYPMIPGIDLSGEVVFSASTDFKKGQKILATGFGLGVTHSGGFSEYVMLPSCWAVLLPENLSLESAMIVGTAGFTAELSIRALEQAGMSLSSSPRILVTGASGGVGSIALKLLSERGYKNLYALTRKHNEENLIHSLGAKKVFYPEDILPDKPKLLDKQQFDFILDTVGGKTISALIPQVSYGGAVSMCGNAGGIGLTTSVLPFIIRGISILGIDSVNYPIEKRTAIWESIASFQHVLNDLPVNITTLEGLSDVFLKIQEGAHIGRTIVKIA